MLFPLWPDLDFYYRQAAAALAQRSLPVPRLLLSPGGPGAAPSPLGSFGGLHSAVHYLTALAGSSSKPGSGADNT